MTIKLRNLILCSFFAGQFFCYSHATQLPNGIIIYAEGQRTCYLFDQMPTVTYCYDDNGAFAQLSISQISEPILSLRLEGDKRLSIEYGEVEESNDINTITIKDKGVKNGKYVRCGRLIIVKDGNLYNPDGTKIKSNHLK